MAIYDAVVVGGGPAGLAAATWLGRYRRHVLVVDSGEYRNASVDSAHGYLGCDPIEPSELRSRGSDALSAYETVERRDGRVERIEGRIDEFTVSLDGEEVHARRVILATGVRDQFPDIDGFFDHYGCDVFHCPTCDGYDARGRDVVALGWSERLTGFSLHLLEWARTVTVVTEGHRFEGDAGDRTRLVERGINVVEDDAVALVGQRGALRSVRLRGGVEIPCQLVFFSIAHDPANGLAQSLGCRLVDEGCIEVDRDGRTSVDGVYAAGDVTPGMQLIQVAAGEGAAAGVACALSLLGD